MLEKAQNKTSSAHVAYLTGASVVKTMGDIVYKPYAAAVVIAQ